MKQSWTHYSLRARVCMQMTSMSSQSPPLPRVQIRLKSFVPLSPSFGSPLSLSNLAQPSQHRVSSSERPFPILRAVSKNSQDPHQRPTPELWIQTSVDRGVLLLVSFGLLCMHGNNPRATPPRRSRLINQSGAEWSTNITAESGAQLASCSTCR